MTLWEDEKELMGNRAGRRCGWSTASDEKNDTLNRASL